MRVGAAVRQGDELGEGVGALGAAEERGVAGLVVVVDIVGGKGGGEGAAEAEGEGGGHGCREGGWWCGWWREVVEGSVIPCLIVNGFNGKDRSSSLLVERFGNGFGRNAKHCVSVRLSTRSVVFQIW